ncbi:uncharacterized protein LOC131335059 isoform X1 [Rhododendron vialii]|uniref:uncharacterized protein LOC131335059 isoform X1 n=1 Tax=Rhododendron vialii TaxID=182163 RepID=UPI00265FC74F|nr:uncharacterized protein LOC131335059 isoform X1 [Rhododendron vialii]
MGVYAAPICHLLSPSRPNPNPEGQNPNPSRKNPIKLHPVVVSRASLSIQRRHLLLFSVPISLSSSIPLNSSALASFDFLSPAERDASEVVSRRVAEAVELLERGRDLQAQGDFNQALDYFTQVIENYKDFALSDYARVGRALALYEVGDREESIAEMEDVSISLKGYPEVHAALAAALYVDKHAPLLAENQFTIATLLDPHYTDIAYVRETKHWPPSLISSLQHFITFS